MRRSLQQIVDEFGPALHGLSASQTQTRPDGSPEKWSIEQILEHLLLSYRSTASVFETRLQKATPTRAKPSLQQRIGQFMLIRMGFFPRGRKAPAGVTPPNVENPRSGSELIQGMTASLTTLSKLSDSMDVSFPHGRRCASHMVLGPLSVRQWDRFHLVHGQHHLKQVMRLVGKAENDRRRATQTPSEDDKRK